MELPLISPDIHARAAKARGVPLVISSDAHARHHGIDVVRGLKEAELETELRPLLARFAKERNAGERFGDWCDRVLLKEQPGAAN